MGIFNKLSLFSGKAENLKGMDAPRCEIFRYRTLAAATNNFHVSNKLGEGGFGPVYEGKLKDGREIAVKKLSEKSKQGTEEFINEANLLSRLQHRNVVELYGYCAHDNEKLLVYERVPNKSLDKLLFEVDGRRKLNWSMRYEIIKGIAQGLFYLHQGSHDCIIHRDIKLSNILIGEDWQPKISDFGMSRILLENRTHVSTQHMAWTPGYVAPEYWKYIYLTVKADIYGYGVLLLEIVSGRKIRDNADLLDWAYKLNQEKTTLGFLDPILADSAVSEQVENCIEIGLRCVQDDPKLRPTMEEVVFMLTGKKGYVEVQIQRPGFYGYGAPESIDVASGLPLAELLQVADRELEEVTPIQGDEFEAEVSIGAEIPDHKPVDEHQNECIPTNSNQIMKVDPHRNLFTFPAQEANVGLSIPTTNNHLSSPLEPSADEEGKVPDTASSELSMDPSQAERKESRTEELSNLHGSVTRDTERDEYIFAEVISKSGAEKDVDATNTESEEERKAVERELSQTKEFLRDIELTQTMLKNDLDIISASESSNMMRQCIEEIGKYENETKLKTRTILQLLVDRSLRLLKKSPFMDIGQTCNARLYRSFGYRDVVDYVEPEDGPSQDIPNGPDICPGFEEVKNYYEPYNSWVVKDCLEEMRKYKKREWEKVPTLGLNNSAKKGSGSYSHQESLKQNTALYAVKRVQELMDKYDNEMSSSFGGMKVLGKEFEKGKWPLLSSPKSEGRLLSKSEKSLLARPGKFSDRVELEKKRHAQEVEPHMDARLQEIKVLIISYLDNYISSLRKWAEGIEILEDLYDVTRGITK